MKKILAIIITLLFSAIVFSQNSGYKVTDLEISPPMEVLKDSKDIKINAKTTGIVKWIVTSNEPLKYEEDQKNKAIIFKSLPQTGSINIFAIASKDGKLTEFANTKITVQPPKEKEITSSKKLNITLFVNYKTLTPQQNEIINIPYTDISGAYSDIQFKILDISNLSEDRLKNYPNGLMIAKDKNKMDVYFGNLPQDVKIFKTILESILNKGN
jgi:hypothetical protein